MEVEQYVRGFARRRPDVRVCTFRFANIVGPGMRTGMTAYLTMPVVPTVMGFDPRMQFVHEDDAVEVSRRAVLQRTSGTFNVAGRGTIVLSQVLQMLGRPAVPLPAGLLPAFGRSLSRGSWADFSRDQIRYLRSGRVLDTSAVAAELGFTGVYSTRQALEAFAQAVHRA